MNILTGVKKIPRNIREMFAFILGFVIIGITIYGQRATSADVLFAEAVHTGGDTIMVGLLWMTRMVAGHRLKRLGTISGGLLCLAGVLAFGKACATLVYSVTIQNYMPVERSDMLLIVGIITVILIALQMAFIWDEHELLHGHTHDHKHLHTVHHAAKTELLADIVHSFAGLFEYIIIRVVPNTPLTIRLVDFIITLSLGSWMIYRGGIILTQGRKGHHCDNHHD